MNSSFRALTLTAVVSTVSGSAMARVVGAPGPEIGDGVVGAAIAAVALMAFVLYPRLKKARQSK